MSKMIALVATAVMVGGVRTVIQPGQELPADLHPHDATELVASGAAEDEAKTRADERASQREQARADQQWRDTRAAVEAEMASTAPPQPTPAPTPAPVKPAKAAK